MGILFFGIILRLIWLGFSPYEPKTHWDPSHMLESDVTNVQALEITKGIWFYDDQGVPSAHRPIGYPFLLGFVYKIFGRFTLAAYGLNLALFAGGLWLVYLLGKIIFDETAGLLAAFFYTIHPVSIYSIKLITDEHLFIPLWFFGIYLLLREMKGRPVRWPLFWYGIIFGYAAMTRTHAIFMPLVVALAYILLKRPWKKVFFSLLTVAIMMQVVNLPWVIRNYKIWGIPVLYTANNSYVYRDFNSSATPEGEGHIPTKGEEGYSEDLEKARSSDPIRYHILSGKLMTRWILEHPKRFLFLGTCRAIYFMGWNRSGGVWPTWFQFQQGSFDPARPVPQGVKDFLEEMAYAFYYALLFCFMFSIFLMIKRWRQLSLETRGPILVLGSCFVFWLMEHMVIYPDRKYRFPLEPLMIVVSAYFLEAVLREFRWGVPGFLKKQRAV